MKYHKDEVAKALNNVFKWDEGIRRMNWMQKYLNRENGFFTLSEISETLYQLGHKKSTIIDLTKELTKH